MGVGAEHVIRSANRLPVHRCCGCVLGGEDSDAKKMVVYLKPASNFSALVRNFMHMRINALLSCFEGQVWITCTMHFFTLNTWPNG